MIVISPAKNLNTNLESLDHKTSTPTLKLKTNKLIKILKELNLIEVKSLMKVSDSLANLNFKRIEVWLSTRTQSCTIYLKLKSLVDFIISYC